MSNVNPQILSPKEPRNARLISNMFLLLFGRLVSSFGTQIYSFALGLYVLKSTGSGMSFAATLICGSLPRIIFGPFAGAIADKIDRKKMVVIMDILSGIIVLVFFGVTIVDKLRLAYILATAFLLSSSNTFFDVPLSASIPNIVDDKSLMRTNSLSQSISAVTRISGPFLGGLIFALVDIKLFLLVNGLSFVFSGIMEMFIDFNYNKLDNVSIETAVSQIEAKPQSIMEQIAEGFRFLKAQRAMFVLFIFAIFLNFFMSLGTAVPFPYIINNILKLSSTQFGIIEAMSSVGMLAGTVILSVLPEKEKKYKSLAYGLLLVSISVILIGLPAMPQLMAFNDTVYFIYYTTIISATGILLVFVNLPIMVTMQRLVPDNMRGRIFGLIDTFSSAITPIGILLSGLLVEWIPAYVIPVGCGIILTIMSVYMIKNKDIKKL